MTIARAVAGTIKRRALKPAATAAAAGLAVGLLSGTLGVGGGELRLPVLILLLGFTAKVAAPINLIVTVITLFGGIGARLYGHAFAQASDFAVEAVIVAAGAAPAAYFGARMLRRLNNRKLSRLVAVLLFGVGALMFAETLLDGEVAVTVQNPAARYVLCLALGVGVGIVVGLLGVGGNELMIPPLVVLIRAADQGSGLGQPAHQPAGGRGRHVAVSRAQRLQASRPRCHAHDRPTRARFGGGRAGRRPARADRAQQRAEIPALRDVAVLRLAHLGRRQKPLTPRWRW